MDDLKLNKIIRLRKYLFFLILTFLIAACSKSEVKDINDGSILAEIDNNYKVTLGDLKQYISHWRYNQRFRDKSEYYRNALDDLITNQLKRFDFFDRKLNENEDLMSEVRRAISSELINTFFDREFVAKYVNDSTATEAYKEMDKEIIFKDLLLVIPENSSQQKLDSLKVLALEMEKRIDNDNEIEVLINKYSLRNNLVKQVKDVTWSHTMKDPVAYVAFQLQKGSTQVLFSYDGFHIIKVIDIKKIKVKPFEEIKDDIISDLKNGYYQAYNTEYNNFRKELFDYGSIIWNEPGLSQIIEWSKVDKFFGGAYKDTIQNAIDKGNNFELLSYNKGIIDLKEFLRLLEEVVVLNPNIDLNPKSVKEFVSDAVYDDHVIKAAQKLGLEKELINPYTNSNVIKSRLTYLYNQAIIEESIPEATEQDLKTFYQVQKDSLFYQLKKINIYTRIYSDSSKAALEIKQINEGTPFEKVSDRWFVKTYIRERDGTLHSFRSNEPPYLAEAAFKLKLNEVDGPVVFIDSEKGKQFAIIKAIHIRPEKQLSFDNVKGNKILEEFKNYYRQKISDDVEKKLKKKYNVEIYKDVLSQAIEAK